MEATRRGFLKGIAAGSLLGLFWPERLKVPAPTKVVPSDVKEDTPHMPRTPLPPQPYTNVAELQPAPHEGPGSYCPFTGQLYTQGACPCIQCATARNHYWLQIQHQKNQYANRFNPEYQQDTYGLPVSYTATASCTQAPFGATGFAPGVLGGIIASSGFVPGSYSGTISFNNNRNALSYIDDQSQEPPSGND